MKNVRDEVQAFLDSMTEIEKEDSKLEQDFTQSIPKDFFYTELKPPRNEQLFYVGKSIKILRLGFSRGFDVSPKSRTVPKYFLYFLFDDYTNLVKFNVDAQQLHNFLRLGNKAWKCMGEIGAFSDRVKPTVNWEEKSVDEVYRGDTISHYQQAYQTIIPFLIKQVLKEAGHGLYIFDAGCGNGALGERFNDSLPKNLDLSKVHYLGFDFQQTNIDSCIEKNIYPRLGSFQFIQGNLLNINQIIRDRVADQKLETIVILSGSLTRNVLPDAFQALLVLQGTAQSNVKYLIGGGLQQPMITDFIARKLGYRNTRPKEKFGHFFLYKKLSEKTILKNKVHKLEREGILDLSLSYRPEFLLNQLKHKIKDGTIIDLSFCILSDTCLEILKELRESYKIKIIFWHFDQQAMAKFQDHFGIFTQFEGANINAWLVKDDIYLMAPRKFFTALQTKHKLIKETKNFMESKYDEKITIPREIKDKADYLIAACLVAERVESDISLPAPHARRYLEMLLAQFSDRRRYVIWHILKIYKLSAENMFAVIKLIHLLRLSHFHSLPSKGLIAYLLRKKHQIFENLIAIKRGDQINLILDLFLVEFSACLQINKICCDLHQSKQHDVNNNILLLYTLLSEFIEKILQNHPLAIDLAFKSILQINDYTADLIKLRTQIDSLYFKSHQDEKESKSSAVNIGQIDARQKIITFLEKKYNDVFIELQNKLKHYSGTFVVENSAYIQAVAIYDAVTRLDTLMFAILTLNDLTEEIQALLLEVIDAYSHVIENEELGEGMSELLDMLTQKYEEKKPSTLYVGFDELDESSKLLGNKAIFEDDTKPVIEEIEEEDVVEEPEAESTSAIPTVPAPQSPVADLMQLNIFTTSSNTSSSTTTTSYQPPTQ